MQSTSADNEQRSSMAGADKPKYNVLPLSHRMEQDIEDPEELDKMENSPHDFDHERNGSDFSTQIKQQVAPYNPGSHHYILDSTGKRGEENRNYNPQGEQRKQTRQQYLTGTEELYPDSNEKEDDDLSYQNGRKFRHQGQGKRNQEKNRNRIDWLIARIDLINSQIAYLQEELQREIEVKYNTIVGEAKKQMPSTSVNQV